MHLLLLLLAHAADRRTPVVEAVEKATPAVVAIEVDTGSGNPFFGTSAPSQGSGVIIERSGVVLTNALGRNADGFVPGSGRAKVALEARLMLALYAAAFLLSLWAQSAVLIWLWLVPVLLGQPFLRLYLMAEHGRCAFVANMFENSRTTFTGPLIRFLAWNMPYHAEHHAYPTVPFHKLPALHALTAPHLRVTSEGYSQFTAETVAALAQGAEPAP